MQRSPGLQIQSQYFMRSSQPSGNGSFLLLGIVNGREQDRGRETRVEAHPV